MANIELISTGWTTAGLSALEKFEEIAKNSEWVVGAMAFFTLGMGEPLNKHPELKRCLQASDSFLCVGWHSPTNFDKIKQLHDDGKGVRFFVNVAKVAKRPSVIEKLNDNLLHSKLLVFKHQGSTGYTVVAGSHNWTNKAIKRTKSKSGLNIEDSIIVHVKRENGFVKSCLDRIEHIKNRCIAYSKRIHRNLLILQASEEQYRIIYFDEKTLPSSPSEVYISFATMREAEKLKQGTVGYLVDPTTKLAVKFTSQGSWSSTNVKADSIVRHLALWKQTAELAFTKYAAGVPSPTDNLALLSLDFMGRKHKATLTQPGKKTDQWHAIGGKSYTMYIDGDIEQKFRIRHWKEENGELHPLPEDLLPAEKPYNGKSIKQLESLAINFTPPLPKKD